MWFGMGASRGCCIVDEALCYISTLRHPNLRSPSSQVSDPAKGPAVRTVLCIPLGCVGFTRRGSIESVVDVLIVHETPRAGRRLNNRIECVDEDEAVTSDQPSIFQNSR